MDLQEQEPLTIFCVTYMMVPPGRGYICQWLNSPDSKGTRGRKPVLSSDTMTSLEKRAKALVASGAGMVTSATFMPHFISVLSENGELDKIKESSRSRFINRSGLQKQFP